MSETPQSLTQRGKQMRASLPALMQRFAQEMDTALARQVSQQFVGGPYTEGPNPTNRLGRGTGSFRNTFTPGNPQHIQIISVVGMKVALTSGSRHAAASVHEHGARIHSKGNMHKWAWGRFYATEQPYFKAVALKIIRDGYVDVKARPVLAPAIAAYAASPDLTAAAERLAVSMFESWGK